MANHHLRNKALSLKAKGLLSLMLSLPEDWDYTTRGLSCICKDGVDSIRVGIQELEANGYSCFSLQTTERRDSPCRKKWNSGSLLWLSTAPN